MMFPSVQFSLHTIQECTSTNDVLVDMRDSPQFHGYAVRAIHQTQGRGRRGRSWWGAEDNLAMSVGFQCKENVSLFPFTCGIALARVFGKISGFCLKWPNDIYVQGKKVGGLLTQARQQGNNFDIILGVGLNLYQSPPAGISSVPSASLADDLHGRSVSEIATEILREWEVIIGSLKSFDQLKIEWESWAKLPGAKYKILGEEKLVEGLELMPQGELKVLQGSEIRILSSEEVSLRFES